ncbi:DUF429 domain-containing protein [Steroidobacter cummioxidans]|uniref:DUF429 domain-containing protein n=1 Tax=Steroidobacter cummioxidans TaxID=1803913 RepID=UPI0012905FA1|nr:DUF429 domain-containing protein [Steroidobacter cummioxidans]
MSIKEQVTAGIDVGGRRKGFHAVALLAGKYFAHTESCDFNAIARWCRDNKVEAVGIDAPCCWSRDGRQRSAERELAAKRLSCFSTPTLKQAQGHPTDYYGWMLNGADMYTALLPSFRLFDGKAVIKPVCFETFPHAIACELAGGTIGRKDKVRRRRELLEEAGIDTRPLTNVDLRDAALCALTAHALLLGRVRTYGDAADGIIVVPTR